MPVKNKYLFCVGRFLVGLLFIVTGLEKLTSPYQNFLYVIQSYEFLPPFLEEVTSHVIPWIEFFAGLFLVLGLWTHKALQAGWLLFFSFILIVAQALIRGLPITECGCFGELISLPPQHVLIMDSALLLAISCLLAELDQTKRMSLDQYFANHS